MSNRTANDYRAHILSYYPIYLEDKYGFGTVYSLVQAIKERGKPPKSILNKLMISPSTAYSEYYVVWLHKVFFSDEAKTLGVDELFVKELKAMDRLLKGVDSPIISLTAEELFRTFCLGSYVTTSDSLSEGRSTGAYSDELLLDFQLYGVLLVFLYRETGGGVLRGLTGDLAGTRRKSDIPRVFKAYL